MQIKGQLRTGYLIQSTLITVVLLLPIIFLLQDDGTNSLLNRNRYWFGLIGFVWLFGGAAFFMIRSFYFISIGDYGIIYTSLFGKKSEYKFEDISRAKSRSATLKSRFYSSPGYQILTLEFKDGEELEISANIYSNFNNLKEVIYRKRIDIA
jgi:hypothetical protein